MCNLEALHVASLLFLPLVVLYYEGAVNFEQFFKIAKMRHVEEVCLLFDHDAIEHSWKDAKKFTNHFKITIAGTDRALAATDDGELIALAVFTGEPQQLWRLDQLADGTWRIMPKSVPNSKEPRALSAIGSSFATLAKFNPESDKQRWLIKAP